VGSRSRFKAFQMIRLRMKRGKQRFLVGRSNDLVKLGVDIAHYRR